MRKRIHEIISVADSGDKASLLYDWVMIVLIVFSILPLCFKTHFTVFEILDKGITFIFVIDYILRWCTADQGSGYRSKKWKTFIVYPFTGYAILDLLAILPSLTPINAGFKLLRIMRLFKALRALKILRYSKNFAIILAVIQKESRALLAVCYLAGGYIVTSALVMFSVEPGSFDSFFDAIYWAVVTLTTVGYGDLYPISTAGRVIGMISSFMGIAVVALPTGIITAGYMDELHKQDDAQED